MMQKVVNPAINAEMKSYNLANGITLSVKVLRGEPRTGRKAIYIHGGGAGGNHTLMERPSRWMIDRGLFDEVILPDRRGAGDSSPLTRATTIKEQGEDMKLLLDAMKISMPVTALGASYGGPIALELAGIDPRIDCVGLIASSPTLKQTTGIAGFLYRAGILKHLMSLVYRIYVGKAEPMYIDMDMAYDVPVSEFKKIYLKGLQHTSADRKQSLLIESESLFDKNNSSVSTNLRLKVPVLQVIGDRDEVWGAEFPKEFLDSMPNLKRAIIPGAIHKDVFTRADEFYGALEKLLRDSRK